MSALLNFEALGHLDLRVLAVQRTVAGRWWNFRKVISPFARLWLILDGRGMVRHHGREFQLRPGRLHLVPPFTEHDCSCAQRLDHYHLHFVVRLPTGVDLLSLLDHDFELPAGAETLSKLQRLETIYPDRKLPCFDPTREEYRRQPVLAERADLETFGVDRLEATGLLTLLIVPFLRQARRHTGTHARVTSQFAELQAFIHAHMQDNLLLGDLARVIKLHPTYFSDRFHELVGMRPLEYLLQRRMERAQYVLLTTRTSIKEVAAAVGYPDAAHFTRAFVRYCGRSPSQYRLGHGRSLG